ncbi:MAG: methylated-DNA--[protein]-cysteine S-methyltransferase [Acidobacteria bacterium]|nr:methylated-DNA--[protein]-cysteine S-methyltransferase [Acidobacteriota bacterium]
MHYAVMTTPLGALTIASTATGLTSVQFGSHVPPDGVIDEHTNRIYIEQLNEYFEGRRTRFEFQLDLDGTPFQLAVWRALLDIPYGQTRSYADIAGKIGKPGAARAVGMANHENPIAIVVPCHRVVGQDGSLTGYAGGVEIKRQLLALEAHWVSDPLPLRGCPPFQGGHNFF